MAGEGICTAPDCGKPAGAAGLCWSHYKAKRRREGPVIGRTKSGEAIRWLEEVALSFDGDDCLTWPFKSLTNGYPYVRCVWATAECVSSDLL